MGFHLGMFAPCVLYLLLPIHMNLAAPGLPGTQRDGAVDAHAPSKALPNPFGSAEEERRLLQSYIQSSLKDGQGPEISTWEQEVFFLFRLYDYDRSGLLDGLEMMKLLSDYSSHHTPGAQTSEMVVSMVDFLLQTQDLNQDGLLAPSELLSPPLVNTQHSSNNNTPHQEEVAIEEKLPDPSADEEKTGEEPQREEAHEEVLPHDDEQPHHEVKTEEEELVKQRDEQNGQHLAEAPAADQGHNQGVPVHQGQPEI